MISLISDSIALPLVLEIKTPELVHNWRGGPPGLMAPARSAIEGKKH